MITREFLEKFNNSELGKVLRLKHFKCSEQTLQKINELANIDYTMDMLEFAISRPGLFGILENEIVYDYIKENNEFLFDMDNIKELQEDLALDFDKFAKGFSAEDNIILNDVMETLETKKMSIYNLRDKNLSFRNLPIEEINISFGSIDSLDLSNLKQLKSLKLNNVALESLDILNANENLEKFYIDVSKDDVETNLRCLPRFKNLRELSIQGSINFDNDYFRLITTLQSVETLVVNTYGREKSKVSSPDDLFSELFGYSSSDETNIGITELEKIFDMSSLKRIDTNIKDIMKFLREPIILNVDDLEKMSKFNLFVLEDYRPRRILYVGKEVIRPESLRNMDDIELVVSSPLVLDENFCQNFHRSSNMVIKVEGDSLKNYELSEISAISDIMSQIISGIPKDSTEFEKVAYIYKIIGEMASYDHSGCIGHETFIEGREEITRSLKGGLVENKLVCRGYALVFKKLLDELRN